MSDDVDCLAGALMRYADNKDTDLMYSRDLTHDGLIHFGFVGCDDLKFDTYSKTNTLYLDGTNYGCLPTGIQDIIRRKYDCLTFVITRDKYNMEKGDNNVDKSLDERAKLKIKIKKDVDTLSKDIVKKHSLDSAHSKADKIAKRIMKSMH